MKKIKLITQIGFVIVFAITMHINVIAQQFLLNEVEVDAPSGDSNACEYTEIRGTTPGSIVPPNTYYLSVNSDGANFGFANQAVNFGGQAVGANGTITLFNNFALGCPGRTYGAGTTFFPYNSPLTQGQNSETFLIVRSTANLFSGRDLDLDDDGVFDAALGITVLDGFGLIVNPEEEYVYGAEAGVVNISNTNQLDQPDAVTRFSNNTTPFVASAFYFGELAATPDSATAYAAPVSPNFPTGGELTPGNQNLPTLAAPQKAVVDFNGDGRTDFSVTRNQSGLLNWYNLINGSSTTTITQWGQQNDISVPEDFDGDGRDDLVIWRSGNPFVAGFYIFQSSNSTFRYEVFGQTGDNPRLVGDWDGDNIADPAVYRENASGTQSVIYYRGSLNNPNRNTTFLRWGTTGDRPIRGDFDGDGRLDATVFRSSNQTWYILQTSNSQVRYDYLGLGTDRFVAADYDGDNRTDLAVVRNGVWYVRQSSNNNILIQNWGLASDVLVPGDYNGDGRSDFAVWRNGIYYILPIGGGNQVFQTWGLSGDSPVANSFVQ